MKIEEARKKIADLFIAKETLTAQEVTYSTKGKIAPIQIYTVLSALVKCGALELEETEKSKSYTLIDESKLMLVKVESATSADSDKTNRAAKIEDKFSESSELDKDDEENNSTKKTKKSPKEEEPETGEDDSTTPTKDKFVQSGRDLTKYKFNGQEYNKGRLAHAIVAQYAKDKKSSLKTALLVFPDDLVPPYGMIKPIKDAKKLSNPRQRFFIKPEEEIKLKDEVIAISNQWTKERIQRLISIAKKQLGYTIR